MSPESALSVVEKVKPGNVFVIDDVPLLFTNSEMFYYLDGSHAKTSDILLLILSAKNLLIAPNLREFFKAYFAITSTALTTTQFISQN